MNHKITLAINYGYFPSANERSCFDIQIPSEDFEPFNIPIERLSGVTSMQEVMFFRPTPESEIKTIMKNRKEVAKRISEEMTEFLLNQMAKKDTMDGYTKDEGY